MLGFSAVDTCLGANECGDVRPDALKGEAPKFERRFRAVLVADVVGYTRLMEAAELETHTRYRALRVGVADPTIIFHRGEIVKNTGDGFVAVFESPADAIRCAAQLQHEVTAQEEQQPPDRRIIFRMGLHWEPVIFDLNDVYGGGVNIAVRLQTAAPAGGIVISSALLDQAGDLTEFKLEDLGELRLKNLSRSVHAFSLRLPGIERGDALRFPGRHSGWAKLPSIAVVPFSNLSPAFTTSNLRQVTSGALHRSFPHRVAYLSLDQVRRGRDLRQATQPAGWRFLIHEETRSSRPRGWSRTARRRTGSASSAKARS